MWNKKIIKKIYAINPKIKIVFFGIDSLEDYKLANLLGAYGIYTNSPLNICQSSTAP